ncbi:hypothetical protein RFI_28091, partial [Reticulomyxa filosa]
NNIGNSNVICSGSSDNTIRFWDIRSNKNELYMIKGDEKEDCGIYCLKFIRLKKKEKTKNVTYDLNLCYCSRGPIRFGDNLLMFFFYLVVKKSKKLHSMLYKELKNIINEIISKYQNKLQNISIVMFFV